MAQVWKLPVLFVCENNLYGMSVSVNRASGLTDLATRADGYGMRKRIVDGQDVVAVYDVMSECADLARRGEGPTFIECKTYRFTGHSRSDPRTYRTREEERQWRDRDPSIRLSSTPRRAVGSPPTRLPPSAPRWSP